MPSDLQTYIQNLPDEGLFDIFRQQEDYTADALSIAEKELELRGLTKPEVKVEETPTLKTSLSSSASLPVPIEKNLFVRLTAEIVNSYRYFFPRGIVLGLLFALLSFLLTYAAFELVVVGIEAYDGQTLETLLYYYEGYELGTHPAIYVVGMIEMGMIAVFATYMFRLRLAGDQDRIHVNHFFRQLDAWYIMNFLGIAVLGGIIIWLTNHAVFYFGGMTVADMELSGYSSEYLSFAAMRFLGNTAHLLKTVGPSLVGGTLVAMAVLRKSQVFWWKQGWRHVLKVVLIILIAGQVFNGMRYILTNYVLYGFLMVTPSFEAVMAVHFLGAIALMTLLLPAQAALFTVPFLPQAVRESMKLEDEEDGSNDSVTKELNQPVAGEE